jgi:hypothetical protein
MELRTRVYPTEARYYCDKCAVFLDSGQEKNPNLKYLPKEEFDKINDHMIDDSVLNVFTPDQILSVLLSINDADKSVEYFVDQKDKTAATVKFYGEMGPTGDYHKPVMPQDKFLALHRCNNPSCKFEMYLGAEYPYVENTVGRMIRNPDELQHPDDVMKNVMKKHVGSTVNSNFKDVNNESKESKTAEKVGESGEKEAEGTQE